MGAGGRVVVGGREGDLRRGGSGRVGSGRGTGDGIGLDGELGG